MRFNWGVLYIVGKIFLRTIRHCPYIFKTKRIDLKKNMSNQSFGTTRIPVLDSHLGVLGKSDIWM